MVDGQAYPLSTINQNRRFSMSWLSKWWRSSGREVVEQQIRMLVVDKLKNEILTKLRVLVAAADGMDAKTIKAELNDLVEKVEAW
jgi:hypothetical protein